MVKLDLNSRKESRKRKTTSSFASVPVLAMASVSRMFLYVFCELGGSINVAIVSLGTERMGALALLRGIPGSYARMKHVIA